jgi:transcriptional regulator with XRE-family HTH domain
MQINLSLIRAEREKRAWSQEQLAAVAGLGLRTIQRVESTGIASNETAKGLAAVFELSLDDLRVVTPKPTSAFWKRPAFASIASACSVLGIVAITVSVQAREIMLNVVLNSSDNESSTFRMITEEGTPAEARLDKHVKLVLLPTLKDKDRVLIAAEIYEYDGTDFKLVSQPKVLTGDGIQARIQIGSTGGKVYDISITPDKIK